MKAVQPKHISNANNILKRPLRCWKYGGIIPKGIAFRKSLSRLNEVQDEAFHEYTCMESGKVMLQADNMVWIITLDQDHNQIIR